MEKVHITKPIPLKTIEVDVGIVEVVNWLNSFHSVETQYSCQGEYTAPEGNEGDLEAGVVFVCRYDEDLIAITRAVDRFMAGAFYPISIKVSYYTVQMPLRYNMIFENRYVVNQFIDFLAGSMERYDHEKAHPPKVV